jgi:hypothetical protein
MNSMMTRLTASTSLSIEAWLRQTAYCQKKEQHFSIITVGE